VLFVSCFLSSEAEKEQNEGEDVEESHLSSELMNGETPSEALVIREQVEAARPEKGKEGFSYNLKRNM
jgi:Na+/melibiose symporter-like transporter